VVTVTIGYPFKENKKMVASMPPPNNLRDGYKWNGRPFCYLIWFMLFYAN
jgi:hypothetical protein